MKRFSVLLALIMVLSLSAGCTGNPQSVAEPSRLLPVSANLEQEVLVSSDLPTVAEVSAGEALPTFESFDKLLAYVEEYSGSHGMVFATDSAVNLAPESAQNDMAQGGGLKGTDVDGGSDYSTTNVQKQGVDEGDIIKTDGKYIYTFNGNSVAIVGVSGSEMTQYSTIRVEDRLRLSEMYVVGDRLVLEGSYYKEFQLPDRPKNTDDNVYYWWPSTFMRMITVFNIYDITDRQAPTLLQEFEVSGESLSTRVIDNTLYYATTEYPTTYLPWDTYREYAIPILEEWLMPSWENSAFEGDTAFNASGVSYFPDTSESNFMLIGLLSLSGTDTEAPQAYFGGGETFYMDTECMAIATYVWQGGWFNSPETRVYKFTLAQDGIVYTANAVVDGSVIDQYSMDVYNGNLRVATSNREGNKVSVFDKQMKLVGSTDGFADSETIRSVRFMGDMVYVVTFRNTDPLFCIDLSDPTKPEILGELKIPGFSQYLHPIDNGLLVGFGRDTSETEWGGFTDEGFKISLFDVSNPRDPRELSVLTYSDADYYSDAFTNPRSILVDQKNGFFVFPAIGAHYADDFDPTIPNNDVEAYERALELTTVWYGVIVVGVQDKTLKELNIAEHGTLSYTDVRDMSYYDEMYFYNPMARYTVRAVYIGDVLFTAGNGTMCSWNYEKFNLLDTLKLN